MFEGFEVKKDAQARKRWFASAGTSAAVYLVLGGIVAIVAGKTVARKMAPEQIDVTFRAEIEEPPPDSKPPPPPPPPPKLKVASVARKPGRPLVEPTKLSDERAEDVADGAAIDPETLGGDGEEEKVHAPPPPPPPPEPPRPPEPVDVSDDLQLAAAEPGNKPPVYPDAERRKGVEAEVLLRLTISPSGEVTDVSVLRGAEPFVTAAIEAVRTWRYQPAREAGMAIVGTRIVRIPFRIRV